MRLAVISTKATMTEIRAIQMKSMIASQARPPSVSLAISASRTAGRRESGRRSAQRRRWR
jgi:hypothetical protein